MEHLHWSETETDQRDGRSFDRRDHSVQWNENGHLCFTVPDFTRLPSAYNLKFALLHLIQASELILKSYVQRCEPAALFVKPKTINLQTALNFMVGRNPNLLTPRKFALLLEAKSLRNAIEHYELEFSESKLRAICIDFLAICMLLTQSLLSINAVEAFSWDYLRNEPDEVADYLSTVLSYLSDSGQQSARRAGELWASETNPARSSSA